MKDQVIYELMIKLMIDLHQARKQKNKKVRFKAYLITYLCSIKMEPYPKNQFK